MRICIAIPGNMMRWARDSRVRKVLRQWINRGSVVSTARAAWTRCQAREARYYCSIRQISTIKLSFLLRPRKLHFREHGSEYLNWRFLVGELNDIYVLLS